MRCAQEPLVERRGWLIVEEKLPPFRTRIRRRLRRGKTLQISGECAHIRLNHENPDEVKVGPRPTFLLVWIERETIAALIGPTLEAMGFELVRVMSTAADSGRPLQVMAERLDRQGMTVDDCAEISQGGVGDFGCGRSDQGSLSARSELARDRSTIDQARRFRTLCGVRREGRDSIGRSKGKESSREGCLVSTNETVRLALPDGERVIPAGIDQEGEARADRRTLSGGRGRRKELSVDRFWH